MIWNPESDPATWPSIDDRVMGGVSQSGMRATDGIAIFEGEVSRDNNGGFASVRSRPANHDLSSFQGVVLKVRGDGKRYRFRLRTTDAFGAVSYQAPLEPAAGEWQEIEISFSAFEPVLRGRPVPGHPPLDPAEVRTLGFLIADGQEGGFRLEVAWIRGLV